MRPFNASETKPVPGFGCWPSPVSPELAAGGTLGFSELQVDGDAVYWLEARAGEGGRRALVRWRAGAEPADVLPATSDIATRVHEYGGGGFTAAGGMVVYVERADGGVWCIEGDAAPRLLALVHDCRFAAFAVDVPRRRVYAVREDHRGRPPHDPANAIVHLALDPPDAATNAGEIVYAQSDFVLAPQLAPGGDRLAFVAWDHPQMPWDASSLVVVPLDAVGTPGEARVVAGGPDESIVEAGWAPDGDLVFAGDRTDWWNLYAWRDGGTVPLAPVDAEVGFPPWVFGRRAFVALGGGRALCVAVRGGVVGAATIGDGRLATLPIGPVAAAPAPYGSGAVYIAVPEAGPAEIRRCTALDGSGVATLRAASATVPDPGDVSVGESLAIPTDDGETTYATFYAPRNARVTPSPGALPPLVVMSHGGPTSMHEAGYDASIAYWTTRGFAVAHVNYRGSSGFGRAYRRRLHGMWGVLDVIDCVSTARFLIASGRVDPERIAIRGGSASGMTALLACASSDLFGAAATRYGVMDLLMLAADDTHKFELRYTDSLVGSLPEAAAAYRERSPVARVDTIRVPVLILQGLDDRVVPPEQAVAIRDALLARGVPVIYEAFAGEGHGFRKAETIRRALELELAFYRDVFDLT